MRRLNPCTAKTPSRSCTSESPQTDTSKGCTKHPCEGVSNPKENFLVQIAYTLAAAPYAVTGGILVDYVTQSHVASARFFGVAAGLTLLATLPMFARMRWDRNQHYPAQPIVNCILVIAILVLFLVEVFTALSFHIFVTISTSSRHRLTLVSLLVAGGTALIAALARADTKVWMATAERTSEPPSVSADHASPDSS